MISAYKIHNDNIVGAINDMNRSSDWHRPEVSKVDKFDNNHYIVFVECDSSYPYRENEWKKLEKGLE